MHLSVYEDHTSTMVQLLKKINVLQKIFVMEIYTRWHNETGIAKGPPPPPCLHCPGVKLCGKYSPSFTTHHKGIGRDGSIVLTHVAVADPKYFRFIKTGQLWTLARNCLVLKICLDLPLLRQFSYLILNWLTSF